MSDKRVDLTYDDSGRFETITRYEDLTATDEIATTTYAYDTTGRLTSLDHAFGTTSLAGYTWTWDAADRITNYTSVLDGSVAYGYDNTGQLTSEARTNLAGTTLTTVYNYDANGNRLTAGDSAAPATYTTGANNRTLSDGTYNYEYDAEGNRTKKTEIASGDEVEYTWNHANLLTEVTYSDSLGVTTKSVSYQYDALGRRIGKSVDDNGNGTIDRSQTFIYDGAGLLAASGGSIQISGPNGQLNQHGWVDDLVLVFEDTDGAGPQSSSLSSRFLHGPAIDQVFAQESATGEVLWALADHQGTIRDWAESDDFDNDGTTETEVVKHITFDAFGNILSITDGDGTEISNGASDILHAYTGQLYDSDAGLHYFRARWYDSMIGRFVSEDPMGFAAQDTNTSRFLGNRVGNGMDPTGLQDNQIPTDSQGNPLLEENQDKKRAREDELRKRFLVEMLREIRRRIENDNDERFPTRPNWPEPRTSGELVGIISQAISDYEDPETWLITGPGGIPYNLTGLYIPIRNPVRIPRNIFENEQLSTPITSMIHETCHHPLLSGAGHPKGIGLIDLPSGRDTVEDSMSELINWLKGKKERENPTNNVWLEVKRIANQRVYGPPPPTKKANN